MSLNTTAVRMKVILNAVKPEVMRRLAVPVTLRLDRLHLTHQAAFGWTNGHLFGFHAGEERWGIPDPGGDFGPQPIDACKARLSDIVQETGAKTIHYLSDFGDSWDHVIKLEKWFDNTTTEGLPLLLDAAGRCPPEDVGGARGYAEYLDAIGAPPIPSTSKRVSGGPNSSILRHRPEGARGRRQRIVGNMEAGLARHALKIDVKRQSKGPQSYAYSEVGRTPLLARGSHPRRHPLRRSMRCDKGLDV
ncbi:hypothetical protein BKD09_41820 [Bradyrhizobium japonicum]|uniref:Plasmid pRiA4b Orf3-like domain-containing protein n=1 Tax=Bradyrhizobium japonicum TaxID=375 RepID=A0A1L3FNJ6_BRAJP|nr:plasmid pRiA4b ORF-3 family protein [Bradyrhizobium japonicum]APG14893.1 hypothetical protein BKD09_41820 [Bradyrhizobium japonicum]